LVETIDRTHDLCKGDPQRGPAGPIEDAAKSQRFPLKLIRTALHALA
jgi:hypothetical protein